MMEISTSEPVTLNSLYSKIQLNLKNSSPLWEDFLSKTNKFHQAIKTVLACSTSFWEAFQKLADSATEAQGSTKEIGTSFTRLCMRQRMIETKLKNLNNQLLVSLSNPIQENMEEWKKLANQIDKDKMKEMKKAKADWKKASGESVKLQKKALKRGSMRGLGHLQTDVELALKTQADKYSSLQYAESLSLRKVMTHERQRYCFLYKSMKPVLESEISLMEDVKSLHELIKTLDVHTASVDSLPIESEQIIQQIMDPMTGNINPATGLLAQPHAAPGSSGIGSSGGGSRKSSVTSSLNSQSLGSSSGGASSVAPKDTGLDGTTPNNNGATGIHSSHLSMASSSVHEASGYSGDYRVSDDDTNRPQQSSSVHTKKADEDEDEDDDDDSEEEDSDGDESDYEDEEEAKTPSSPTMSLWSEKLSPHADLGHQHQKSVTMRQHHTISGAQSREYNRQKVSNSVFEPPINQNNGSLGNTHSQSNSSLQPADQSKQLYPNQAIPLPAVYTNLKELTNAAQRKYSMNINTNDYQSNNSQHTGVPIYATSVSQGGSRTPSVRRMTLPEINDKDPQVSKFKKPKDPSPNQSGNIQSNTLTRQQSDQPHSNIYSTSNNSNQSHYQTPPPIPQKTFNRMNNRSSSINSRSNYNNGNNNNNQTGHYRATSIGDQQFLQQQSIYAETNSVKRTSVTENARPIQHCLIQELQQQQMKTQTPSNELSPAPNWTELDPDLPMPPPPSTVDEEIRLAAIPPPSHQF